MARTRPDEKMKESKDKGDIEKHRTRWAQVKNCDVVQYSVPSEVELQYRSEEHEKGWGDSVLLMFAAPSSKWRHFTVDLSLMNEDELDTFLKMVTDTVEDARVVVRERTRKAKEAFDDPDDDTIYDRLYRPAPHYVERARP